MNRKNLKMISHHEKQSAHCLISAAYLRPKISASKTVSNEQNLSKPGSSHVKLQAMKTSKDDQGIEKENLKSFL